MARVDSRAVETLMPMVTALEGLGEVPHGARLEAAELELGVRRRPPGGVSGSGPPELGGARAARRRGPARAEGRGEGGDRASGCGR